MFRSSCRSNGRYLSTTIPEFWSRIQLAKEVLCSDLIISVISARTRKCLTIRYSCCRMFRRLKTSTPNLSGGVYEKIKCG